MPKGTVRYWLVGIFVAAALGAPSGAADREHQQIMAGIRILQGQVQDQQVKIEALTDALASMAAMLEKQNDATLKAIADQKVTGSTIVSELRVVREKVDDNNTRVSSVGQEVEAVRFALTSLGVSAPALGAESPSGRDVDPAVTGALGMSPKQIFDAARSDYMAGSWSLAIEGFEAYLRAYPTSFNAGEAQYYMGQAYFKIGRFEEAVETFNRIITAYPGDQNILASAYYSRGMTQERLGQAAAARESYEHVIKNFAPENPSRSLARQALDRLSKAGK